MENMFSLGRTIGTQMDFCTLSMVLGLFMMLMATDKLEYLVLFLMVICVGCQQGLMLWLRFQAKALQVSIIKKDSVEWFAAKCGIFLVVLKPGWQLDLRSQFLIGGGCFGTRRIYQDMLSWLATRDRLTTQVRLLKWGYQGHYF